MRNPEPSTRPTADADAATAGSEPAAAAPIATPWSRSDVVVVLVFGAVGASAPAAATLTALLSAAPPGLTHIVLFTAVSILVAGAGIRAVAVLLRRHVHTTHPALVTLATVGAQVADALALDRVAPFRIGLLSVLLYCAPALVTAMTATVRSRAALGRCAAAAVGLGVSACVLGPAQQHWSAQEWIAANRLTTPALAEVVDVPGMRQLPYRYDQDARQLTAVYTEPLFDTDAWTAVETVTAGTADPCGALTVARGDGLGTQTPGCTQIAPHLWLRSDASGSYGYVLQRNGVTIALAGPVDDGLLSAIEAARPATDADLWARAAPVPASPIGWLLQ